MVARQELKRRPTQPATVTREVQAGDIRRQVEVPAEKRILPISEGVKNFMADMDRRRAASKSA